MIDHPAIRVMLLTLASMLFACSPAGNSGSGEILVRVYDKYLYESDLEGVIPPGASPRDSLTAVRNYIQNWVDRELIVKKAEENLPAELKDFSDRIEEYRKSLTIFEYEKMLVRQELDTNISSEAVFEYYDRNRHGFVLREDILKMNYLVLHTDSPAAGQFRKLITSTEPDERDSLALYCSKYATAFALQEDNWVRINQLSEHTPVEHYSYADFRANRRYMELRDSVFIYMVSISDFRPADSISPVQFVEDEIRKVILNRRKNDLIRNMRQTVLQDAIENNQVEIY